MNIRLTTLLLSLFGPFLAAQSAAIQFTQEDGSVISMEERMALEQTKGAALIVLVDGQAVLQENWELRV